ncbi:MAG: hypothetical protein ACOYT4_03760 [Nanoarchaeota archaeon]
MKEMKIKNWNLEDLSDKTIFMPQLSDAAYIVAAGFRNIGKKYGFKSEVLPSSSDPSFKLARRYTNGDQCLPSIITTQDMLELIQNSREGKLEISEEQIAFFQGGSCGPCRFGRYYMNQQLILEEIDASNIPIFTISNRDSYRGVGSGNKILMWDGIVAQGLLERALNFTKPYEDKEGESEVIYKKYLEKICSTIEQGFEGNVLFNSPKPELLDILRQGINEFSKVERQKTKKPIIYITGEIFVRNNKIANQKLAEKIIQLGGIPLIEPPASFFSHVNEFKYREAKREHKFSKALSYGVEKIICNRNERTISELFHSYLGNFAHDPSAIEVIKEGSKYFNEWHQSEAIVTVGSSYYLSNLLNGIINVFPFACMPGNLSRPKLELIKKEKKIPILNLAYDGSPDPNREDQIENFMEMSKDYLSRRQPLELFL